MKQPFIAITRATFDCPLCRKWHKKPPRIANNGKSISTANCQMVSVNCWASHFILLSIRLSIQFEIVLTYRHLMIRTHIHTHIAEYEYVDWCSRNTEPKPMVVVSLWQSMSASLKHIFSSIRCSARWYKRVNIKRMVSIERNEANQTRANKREREREREHTSDRSTIWLVAVVVKISKWNTGTGMFFIALLDNITVYIKLRVTATKILRNNNSGQRGDGRISNTLRS